MTPDGKPGPLRGGSHRCEAPVGRRDTLCGARATWWTGTEYRCTFHKPKEA